MLRCNSNTLANVLPTLYHQVSLTEMVHDMRFAPLGSVRTWSIGTDTAKSRVKQQIVNLLTTKLLKRLFSERLDPPEITQFKRENSNAAR
jgi:hypothetical protein